MSAWLARPRLRQGQGVGQQNPKRGAAAGAVLHPGPPALQFDEASNQRQPDADAAGVAGMLRSLVERLEQGRPQLRWDAGAGILDRRHQQQRDRLQGPHLGRHPTATLCVFTDNFFGPWIQIDGTAEIVPLPEAIEGLVDYYRRVSGEHPDWDDYRRTMVNQRRVLIRLSIDNVGPTHAG